ncbi:hydrolase [Streptomyces sp. ID01-12c]|uniref:hydrolase n=1 Tax=Streptomyces caniscabiei TaxID=2746961 RepID=UPI001785C20E|nr:hydrolase [Streptomyces caniscabiei]MBD9703659.1 hydrolase [Streptomyces caniscabiei]MDX3733712.1 hydrolase [Streptomyces caniscabiei]
MSLWTSLEPASATVDPGSSTTVRLRLRNTGDVVDEYRFEPVGDIAPWTTVEPQTLRLYPGTTGSVELTFAPPRTPDATAGPNAYAVRILPTEHPEATTVPEGNLTITPFTEVRAELVPPTVKGRFRGRPKLAVDNLGNTKVTASVSGSDNGDQLSYDIHPSNVQIEPGRAAFVKATLKPRQIIWFGSKEERPYTFAVKRSGVTPLDVEGTYVQRSFLPGWLATCLGVFLALAITFLTLWLAYRPPVVSATTELREAGVSTLPPSPSPSLSAPAPPTPSPPAVSSAPPQTEEPKSDGGSGGGGDDGGGGSGGGGEEKPKKAPTAATAVRQLAASDPGGRHICYRAFVKGKGWTAPECDGDTAGTVGKATPLTALNIAVAGVGGTASAAFVHNPGSTNGQGHYVEPWSGAPDGLDNYIGDSKKDAPAMLGFTINVDDGARGVCQSVHQKDRGWQNLACDKPGEGEHFIFGGTLDNGIWLEAVKFTV